MIYLSFMITQVEEEIKSLENEVLQLTQSLSDERDKLNNISFNLNILAEEVNELNKRIDELNESKLDKTDLSSLPSRENLDDAWAGGYFGDGRIVCRMLISTCQHELGHAQDEFLGYPSISDEFKADIALFLELCDEKTIKSVFCYTVWYAPGIGDNPLRKATLENGDVIEWGGFRELYASLFKQIHTNLMPMPFPLDQYFRIHIDRIRVIKEITE